MGLPGSFPWSKQLPSTFHSHLALRWLPQSAAQRQQHGGCMLLHTLQRLWWALEGSCVQFIDANTEVQRHWLTQHTPKKWQSWGPSLRLPDSHSSVPPLKLNLASLLPLLSCFACERPQYGCIFVSTSSVDFKSKCSRNHRGPPPMLFTPPWRWPTAGADILSSLKHKHLSLSASGLSLSTGQSGADWKCRIHVHTSHPQAQRTRVGSQWNNYDDVLPPGEYPEGMSPSWSQQ